MVLQLTSLSTFFRSSSVKFSNLLKGLAVSAVLITCATEAYAQLPLRTRTLQLIGSTSGTLTHEAAAATTSYTLTWPAAAPTAGNNGFLQSDPAGTMSWFLIPTGEQLVTVDANGAAGQVAYFTDANSLTSSPRFQYDDASANLTLGNTTPGGQNGTIILGDGDSHAGTINVANLTAAQSYTLPDASGTIPVTTNTPAPATAGFILVANADGTSTWTANPLANVERGVFTPTAGSYTAAITVTGTPDLTNDVILVTSYDTGGGGQVLQVTGVAAGTITVSASGPFVGTERISWIWIPIP